MKNPAYYAITFGMTGCYMPDSHNGAHCFTRRKDLAETIRSYLEMYDLPASLFHEVKIKKLWKFIKRNGASVAHFSLDHEGHTLSFHGLTEEEYNQQNQEE